jgi:excisionase family DNA binding protein
MAKRLLLNPAAEALGVTPHFLRTEAKAERIPHIRCGNRYLFDVDQVEEFLKQRAIANVKIEPYVNASYGVLRKIAT